MSFLFYIGVAASLGGVFFLTTLIEQVRTLASASVLQQLRYHFYRLHFHFPDKFLIVGA